MGYRFTSKVWLSFVAVMVAWVSLGVMAFAADQNPSADQNLSADQNPNADSFSNALASGKFSADVRYRLESVDDKAFTEKALASTVRARLGYETAPFGNFFAYADVEAVANIGNDRYNSTANGQTDLPLVADPQDTEVNQAFLAYTGLANTTLQVGRQRVSLQNSRFIGNNGWRQNEQTFDAASVRGTFRSRLTGYYAHIINVNMVAGEHNPNSGLANQDVSTDLFNLECKTPVGTATGYAYLINLQDIPDFSHQDLGVRFNGEHGLPILGLKGLYSLEYAAQQDYAGGSSVIDASYYLAELGAGLGPTTVKAGYEVLGSPNGTYGFQTPLASQHNFNGWAEQFSVTPNTGLVDAYAGLRTSVATIGLTAMYHQFTADSDNTKYGTEIDLGIEHSFRDTYSASLVYAGYSADNFSTDTSKLWLTFGLKI